MIVSLPSGQPGRAPSSDKLADCPSFVMYERGRLHNWAGVGPLSLKSFVSGEAWYKAGGGRYRLDHRSYLVLNHRQPYEISIDSDKAVESFCLFFEAGFAEQVAFSLTTSNDRLLTEPAAFPISSTLFFERTYPHNEELTPLLTNLRLRLDRQPLPETAWLQEQFNLIMTRMLQVHREVSREVETLSATRAATRQELYRRLYRVKDYLDACYNRPLNLDELAAVGCLSPNHMLRTFKELFKLTPHQYLTARRLERAGQLLILTDLSVTEICFMIGFESLGSFSWLFRRQTGLSPLAYRLAKR